MTTWTSAFRTLAYFDGANLAARATAPALFSVALMDRDLPAVDGLRRLQPLRRPQGDVEYPFNDHEGGRASTRWEADWLPERFGA